MGAPAAPWLDQWAPPQFGFAISGGQGPAVNPQAQQSSFDTTLHWKVSGTIILALVVIFGLQFMGFRFVVAANTSFGIGK